MILPIADCTTEEMQNNPTLPNIMDLVRNDDYTFRITQEVKLIIWNHHNHPLSEDLCKRLVGEIHDRVSYILYQGWEFYPPTITYRFNGSQIGAVCTIIVRIRVSRVKGEKTMEFVIR